MKGQISKGIAISLVLAIFCFCFSFASEDGVAVIGKGTPTILKPSKGSSGNTKLEIPPFIQLSAVIDKDLLTITSSENVIARVTITDETEEECYFDCTVPLSPDYSCLLPNVNSDLILHVFIGEKEYIGYLEPEW